MQTKVIMAKTKSKKSTKKKKAKPFFVTSGNTGTETTFTITDADSGTEITLMTTPEPRKPEPREEEKPHGHFSGAFWVWPNGKKTHVRFIDLAIRQMKPLPRGFYVEAEKETYLTNMKHMLRKAKQLKLPDSVDIRNEDD